MKKIILVCALWGLITLCFGCATTDQGSTTSTYKGVETGGDNPQCKNLSDYAYEIARQNGLCR